MTDFRKPIRARLESAGKTVNQAGSGEPYRTTSTELAAFLRCAGHPIIRAYYADRVWFEFGATDQRSADASARAFFSGEEVSAIALFQHWREVRDIVNEVLRREKGGRA